MPIYTKRGDGGKTQLLDCSGIAKSDPRLESLGANDELNSFIGVLTSGLDKKFQNELEILTKIQSAIFSVNSEIADPKIKEFQDFSKLVSLLEKEMDKMTDQLPELKNFILPGGSQISAVSHICRTAARRAERSFVKSHDGKKFNPTTLKFLNRLSDYFFTLSRFLNFKSGVEDTVWKKIMKKVRTI